jgi:Arc/MetJ-type ribon-helix-helix transcriptional regulator
MSTTKRTQSKLRQTLQQEDVSLAERLPAAAEAVDSPPSLPPPSMAAKADPPPPVDGAAAEAAKAVAPARSPAKSKARATPAGNTPHAKTSRAQSASPVAVNGEAQKRIKGVKQEKVERDSFSMPANEHKRIKALREALGRHGVLASKSEVLRAGLALLASREPEDIAALVASLPKIAKGKRSKKH